MARFGCPTRGPAGANRRMFGVGAAALLSIVTPTASAQPAATAQPTVTASAPSPPGPDGAPQGDAWDAPREVEVKDETPPLPAADSNTPVSSAVTQIQPEASAPFPRPARAPAPFRRGAARAAIAGSTPPARPLEPDPEQAARTTRMAESGRGEPWPPSGRPSSSCLTSPPSSWPESPVNASRPVIGTPNAWARLAPLPAAGPFIATTLSWNEKARRRRTRRVNRERRRAVARAPHLRGLDRDGAATEQHPLRGRARRVLARRPPRHAERRRAPRHRLFLRGEDAGDRRGARIARRRLVEQWPRARSPRAA